MIANSKTVARAATVALLLATCICGVSAAVGWSSRTTITTGLALPTAAASIGNTAYFGNGADSQTGLASSYVLTYNSVTQLVGNYSEALFPGRRDGAAAVVGRSIIFAGGRSGSTYSPAAAFINVDTGDQTENPNALNAQRTVVFACSNAAKTKALFWGGVGTSNLNMQQPDVFNGGSWLPVNLPSNYQQRAFEIGTQIGGTAGSDVCVLAGGSDTNSNPLFTADIYTFSTGVLRSNVSGLTVARRFAAAASYGNRVLFAGGQELGTGTHLTSIEYYDAGTDSWGILPVPLSLGRSQFAAVATLDGRLVFFAGGHYSTQSSVVDMYNTTSGAMTLSRPLSTPASQLLAVAVGTQVLLTGGYDATGEGYYLYTDVYESSYCAGSTPCANGGTCVNGFTGYSCACTSGWSGPTCSVMVAGPSSSAGAGGVTGAASGASASGTTGISAAAGVRASGAVYAAAVLVAAAALRI